MTILTEQQKAGVRNFVYKGRDDSLVYKYFLSPFAQFILDALIPTWMAPNVITTIGLLSNIIVVVLVAVYNPDLSEDSPHSGWLALTSALSMFIYQTFDNMDGKQARKTNSASPLGLLYDHGCDALNVGLSILPVASALGLGWKPERMLFNLIPFIPFYTQTWELFYVDEMVLPIINGPSDGLLLAMSMMLTTFWRGNAKWFHEDVGGGVVPLHLMTFLACAGAFVTGCAQVRTVFKKLSGKPHAFGKKWESALSLTPFVVFYCSVVFWLGSPNTKAFSPENRSWTVVLVSSVFVEIVSHINFAHITMEARLRPLERYMVLCPAYLALSVHLDLPEKIGGLFGEEPMLKVFATICLCVTLRMMHLMNIEVAECLGINVFVMGPRRGGNLTKTTNPQKKCNKNKQK